MHSCFTVSIVLFRCGTNIVVSESVTVLYQIFRHSEHLDFSSSARYACHLKVCISSFHKFQWILCILEFLRGPITTLSLTFSLHVDFYKAKARLIGMCTAWISSSPARGYWSRIGVLPRVMWLPSSEQSESHFLTWYVQPWYIPVISKLTKGCAPRPFACRFAVHI